jgi:hypothetical protein
VSRLALPVSFAIGEFSPESCIGDLRLHLSTEIIKVNNVNPTSRDEMTISILQGELQRIPFLIVSRQLLFICALLAT